MAEYIERNKVLAAIQSRKSPTRSPAQNEMLRTIRVDVNHIPAADVAPVVRGRWIWRHRHHGGFRKHTGVDEFGETHTITVDERSECDEPYCPNCGKWNESIYRNFCPNCGADMREG